MRKFDGLLYFCRRAFVDERLSTYGGYDTLYIAGAIPSNELAKVSAKYFSGDDLKIGCALSDSSGHSSRSSGIQREVAF